MCMLPYGRNDRVFMDQRLFLRNREIWALFSINSFYPNGITKPLVSG